MPVNTADLGPGSGGGNNPGGLAALTSFGYLSSSTSGSGVRPIYSFSDDSLGFFESGVSTVALSYGTFNLNQGRLVSIRTVGGLAAPISIQPDEVVLSVPGASGSSILWKSAGTVWIFNSTVSST